MAEEDFIEPGNTQAIEEADQKEHGEITNTQVLAALPTARLTANRFETYSHDCHTEFHAAHSSGKRPLKVITTIVIHSTEGGTAQSVARYFSSGSAGGSTQLVVDDFTCYRCLADEEIPWAAPGANYFGLHIEQCGFAHWSSAVWSKTHRRTLLRCAWKTAYHCRKYGIRPYFLTAAQLKAGKRNGVTTHYECTRAFGGSHTDPGRGWPRLLFMTMVRMFWVKMKNRVVA